MIDILTGRQAQIHETGADAAMEMACDRHSLAGSVSQRACVFCGSRVVLYPICDAIHLVHGPIGCAAYTWDIRGALSSGPELHRMSFSTDLQETDVIYGGETKLYRALRELIDALPAQGRVRLLDLYRGPDRRRRRCRLSTRVGRVRHSRAAGRLRRLQGYQEGRLQGGLRLPDADRRHRFNRGNQRTAASTSWEISTWRARLG